jgi:hypothetical protein
MDSKPPAPNLVPFQSSPLSPREGPTEGALRCAPRITPGLPNRIWPFTRPGLLMSDFLDGGLMLEAVYHQSRPPIDPTKEFTANNADMSKT